jgi:Right handed beta helix region
VRTGTRHAPRRATRAVAVAVVAAASGLLGATAGVPASAAGPCDRVASPTGSDSAAGSAASPYRSAQKLVESLSAGETGCLRSGSYGGSDLRLDEPRVTLRSYPGESAKVTAFLEVYPEAERATVTGLRFDSTRNGNDTGVKLQADGAVFSHNELTKGGRGICLLAGSYTKPRDIVIERNHIHDCGPRNSKYDHQLYLVHTRGARVRWNILRGNAGGWGVHFYPDADGTLVEHNIIDGNRGGVVFAGEGRDTSDHNVVRNNAITYNGPRWNLESSWSGGPRGGGNQAVANCVYSTGADAPTGIGARQGFSTGGNAVLGGSPYANRARGDYRFRSDSPCARLVGNVAGTPVAGAMAAGGRARLSLRSTRRRVRPARRVLLRGRLRARRPPAGARVALQLRGPHGWRTVARRRLRSNGRFRIRVRMGRSRRPRTARLRAVVRGVAKSRTLRLRIRD